MGSDWNVLRKSVPNTKGKNSSANNKGTSLFLDFQFYSTDLYFYHVFLYITINGILKSPTNSVEFSLSPFKSISFYFVYFGAQ